VPFGLSVQWNSCWFYLHYFNRLCSQINDDDKLTSPQKLCHFRISLEEKRDNCFVPKPVMSKIKTKPFTWTFSSREPDVKAIYPDRISCCIVINSPFSFVAPEYQKHVYSNCKFGYRLTVHTQYCFTTSANPAQRTFSIICTNHTTASMTRYPNILLRSSVGKSTLTRRHDCYPVRVLVDHTLIRCIAQPNQWECLLVVARLGLGLVGLGLGLAWHFCRCTVSMYEVQIRIPYLQKLSFIIRSPFDLI